jgi:hypothetical protein
VLLRAVSISTLLWTAFAAAGCKKVDPVAQIHASASASAATPALPGGAIRLATPTAFELVASRAGATLVFAAPGAGGMRKVELEASGKPVGPATTTLDPSVLGGEPFDLGAAWVGERIVIGWLERAGTAAKVRAAWGRTEKQNAATKSGVFELGPAWLGPRTARGNLSVMARGDDALVFARGTEARCVDTAQTNCFGFSFHEIGPGRTDRSGLPLVVPVPCTDDSTALAVVGERFHYGVCTDGGKAPVTTLFTIERDPEYARADRLLEGCRPKGTLVWGGAAWLIGDCEGNRRAVRVAGRDEPLEYLDLRTTRFECTHGEARIRAPGLDLLLDEPRARLEAILPSDMAPSGSRATWAGRALVVASATGDVLGVKRAACEGNVVRTEGVGVVAR